MELLIGGAKMGAVGFVSGAILGMALFGSLIAWIIRWVVPIRLYWSYAVGILIMLPVAAWSYAYNFANASVTEGFFIYGVGGLFAFPLLISTSLIGGQPDHADSKYPKRTFNFIARALGWGISSLLLAVGLTLVFVATKEQGAAAPPFFFGVICLMAGSALAWGLIQRSAKHSDDAR